jgi:hypothetical protein
MFAPPICRRRWRNNAFPFRQVRRRRRHPANIAASGSEQSSTARSAASGSEQSDPGSRAAVLSQAGAPLSWTSERADTLFRLRASEEGSG